MNHWGSLKRLGICTILLAVAGSGAALAQSVDPAEKKLAGAEGLLARGQYDLARQEFDEFLHAYPRSQQATRAQYGKALCAYHSNDLATAAAELEAVTGNKTFLRRDEALAVLATVYLSAGAPEKALATSAVLLKDHPASQQIESVTVNRAQALYRLARYDDSLAEVAAMLKAYPKSPHRGSALYVAALDQRAMGNDAAATVLLEGIAAKYPNAPFVYDAQIMIGETLAGQAKFDAAVAHLTRLRTDAPESRKAAIDFSLGVILVRAGRFDQAQKTFDALIAADKSSPLAAQATLQKAVAQLKSGRGKDARESLTQVSREYPAVAASAAYWLARCDIADGNLAKAKSALLRLAEVKPAPPEGPEVLFDLAYTELMAGQDAQALRRLEAFHAAYPYIHDVEALYYQATALHHLAEFGKSIAICDQIAKRREGPLTRSAAILKAENLVMQKSYGNADVLLATLQSTATDSSEKLRLALRRAQCAYFSGDYKAAEGHLRPFAAASSKDPLHGDVLFLFADAQLQQAKADAAVASFKAYLADENAAAHVHEATYKLGLAQRGSKDANAAIATLTELAKDDIRSVWVQRAKLELAQLAYDDKNVADAERMVAALLAAGPAEPIAAPASYLLARIELDTARYDEAAAQLAALAKAFSKHPLAEEALFARGVALTQAGKPAEAVKQFDAYVHDYPKGRFLTQAWHQGAVALTAAGKPAEAAKILAQLAGDRATRSDTLLYDYAWAQRSSGDSGGASSTYESLIKEFPGTPRAASARVELAELNTEDPAAAAALLTTAIKDRALDGKSRAVAVYRLGQTYIRLGEPSKAAEAFDTFVAENPKDALVPAALCEAGAAQLQAGRVAEAKRRLNRVLTEFPKSDAARLAVIRLGDAQNQAGEYDTAAATFTRFLADHRTDPLVPQAHLGLGWSLENRNKPVEAREQYAKVIAADNSAVGARAQFQTGETYFAQKQFELAAKELLKVDIQYRAPEWSARALYEAGRAFEQLNDRDRARQQFQDCVKKYPSSDVAPLARKRLESL